MKKLFAVVVLGSMVLIGCDKPATTASKRPMSTPVAPPAGKGGDPKTEADKKAADDAAKKATDDAAKKAADDAGKKAADPKDKDKGK